MLMNISEFARNKGVSRGFIQRLIKKGAITVEYINERPYIPDTERVPTQRKNEMHGYSKTNLYKVWAGMKQRCYNEKNARYYQYGGRGISVCKEWRDSFMAFCDWSLSHGYSESLQIDRIDCDGNYCPENCRWVTQTENMRNRRPYKTTVKNSEKFEMPVPDYCIMKTREPVWLLSDSPIIFFEGKDQYREVYPDGLVIRVTHGERRVVFRDAQTGKERAILI